MFITQPELTWWDKNDPSQAHSAEIRKWWCDSANNPENPFYNYIGNEKAVKQLNRAAFVALGRFNHLCNDQSFALIGPASTGKTTLARMFATTVKLPFVEISAQNCNSVLDLVIQIAQVLEDFQLEDGSKPLELMELEGDKFVFPPCIVFIDEVHALPKKVEQGLLKATEKNDSTLAVNMLGSFDNRPEPKVFDTSRICWIIATTDRGLLFDAFDTRFEKIVLNLYSLEEIAEIVQVHNQDWDFEVCELVAKFAGRVPREALAFAKAMRLEHEMNGGDWEDIAEEVAEEKDIDEYGMTRQHIAILTALGEGPISKSRLCSIANCKEAELLKFIIPPLLATTSDQKPLIRVSSKGFALTRAGAAELDRRHILYSPDIFDGKPTLANRLNRNTRN